MPVECIALSEGWDLRLVCDNCENIEYFRVHRSCDYREAIQQGRRLSTDSGWTWVNLPNTPYTVTVTCDCYRRGRYSSMATESRIEHHALYSISASDQDPPEPEPESSKSIWDMILED